MKDWRIYNENYFKNIKLFKVTFPDYWKQSYTCKNDFYKFVFDDASNFTKYKPEYLIYLKDDQVRKLWHTHCDLCTKTITIDENAEYYCTEDYFSWICKECFEEFKMFYNWVDNGAL